MEDPSHFRIVVPNDTDLKRHQLKSIITHLLLCIGVATLRMHVCPEISVGETWQSICAIGFIVALTSIIFRTVTCMASCKFEFIKIDFVGKLPCSPNRNKWILTAVFPFSNYLVAIQIRDKTATTAA